VPSQDQHIVEQIVFILNNHLQADLEKLIHQLVLSLELKPIALIYKRHLKANGYYDPSTQTILLDHSLKNKTFDQLNSLQKDSLIHEFIHHFQWCCVHNHSLIIQDDFVQRQWKANFLKMVPAKPIYQKYLSQPIEQHARYCTQEIMRHLLVRGQMP
jgi:hypothetical protein